MLKRIEKALEAFGEFIIAGLEKMTEDLKQYPESRYWQGYEDAINHLNREKYDDEKRKTTPSGN